MKNPFGVDQRVILRSPLSVTECEGRLREVTGSIWNPLAAWTNPVRGSVNERGFCIVRAIHYRNSMQSEARGTWAEDGDGTRIEVTLSLNRLSAVMSVVALGLIFLAAIVSLVWDLPRGVSPDPGPDWLWRLFPIAVLAFIAGTMALGRWLARGDNAFLIDLLRRTLQCSSDAAPIE